MSWFSSIVDNFMRSDIGRAASNPLSTTGAINSGTKFLSASSKFSSQAGDAQANREALMTPLEQKINDAKISPQMKAEIRGLKLHPSEIEAELQKAVAGEGKYMNRQRNYNYLMLSKDRPAAMQLFSNARSRMDAGSGLLTGRTEGLLGRSV